MFNLGDKVKFEKHIKKSIYDKDKKVSKEFCDICGLNFREDRSFMDGFFIPRTKWRGFKSDKPITGIICGARNIGTDVWSDDYGGATVDKRKQIYLVANKMSGFYYVLPEWLSSAE